MHPQVASLEKGKSVLASSLRCRKAPPIDPFSAESIDKQRDDWLPTFERAAEWNAWTDSERLLQLAGHLRGKARQQFSLLSSGDKATFFSATVAMRSRLDAGSHVLAAQYFRHATQGPQETVSDYILRLEKIFRRDYGREHMTEETRKPLLHGQLQEGLRYVLMKAPAVSGARDYQELCTAAKNEEHQLIELNKRQQYKADSHKETTTQLDLIMGGTQQPIITQGIPPHLPQPVLSDVTFAITLVTWLSTAIRPRKQKVLVVYKPPGPIPCQ